MFEVPAARSLLLTEYTPHLEEHYVIDKEIVAFKTPFEMYEKARALLQNPKVIDSIANKGYKRFIKDHESHVRLANVLEEIDRL